MVVYQPVKFLNLYYSIPLQGSLFNDHCEVQCCPLCVLCQLARELNYVARN